MTNQTLKRFINNIDEQKPVNLRQLHKTINRLSLTHRFNPTDIEATATSRANYYLVDSIHPSLLKELRQLIAVESEDRVSGSLQGRSHDHNVNGSLLLIRKGTHHPEVIVFDEQGDYVCQPPLSLSSQAILIENRQLFIHVKKTFDFLYQCCEPFIQMQPSTEIDVIFAAGNEISNRLHHKLLQQYERLYLLFDIDLGGLSIANNLYNLNLNNQKVFLYPNDIAQRFERVVERITSQQMSEVARIGVERPELKAICHLIRQNMKFIEQESYLYAD